MWELTHLCSHFSGGEKIERLLNLAEKMSEADGLVRYVGTRYDRLGVYLDTPGSKNFFKVIGPNTYLVIQGKEPVLL